jgi:hypothetical protein
MKECDTCHFSKNESEYNKNRTKKDGLNSICRECSKIRSKKYYQENKKNHIQAVISNTKKYRKQLTKLINKVKKVGCRFCNEKEICCLDFHHLRDKQYDISRLIHNLSITKLVVELQKCILVCSNCHRKIHAGLISYEKCW